MQRAILIAVSLLYHIYNANGQMDTLQSPGHDRMNDSQALELLAENSEGEIDYSDLAGKLEDFRRNPINLNAATPDDLKELGLLNEFQIRNLTDYVKIYGRILSINEIRGIDGFDATTIEAISPYIVAGDLPVKENFNIGKLVTYARHDLILRYQQLLEQQKGYKKTSDSIWNNSPGSHYLGDPLKLYARYRINSSRYFSAGFLAEKDAGEVFFNMDLPDSIQKYTGEKLRKGFDHYSGFINLKNIGIIESVIVGDYHIQIGQGLTLWSNMTMGKGGSAIQIYRHARGIMPVSSSDENRFFRGAAIEIRLPANMKWSCFYSGKKYDANIVNPTDSLGQEEYSFASSLLETGLHRTVNELLDKDNLHMTVTGSNLTFLGRRFKAGITGLYTSLDKDIRKEEQLYNQYAFKGSENFNAGADMSFLMKRFLFYTEFSGSKNMGLATLAGIIIKPSGIINLSVLYRDYQRNFQNFYSNAFGENSTNANEKGLYTGLFLTPSAKITINAYADHYRFPWLKYRVNGPSEGSEWFSSLNYTLSRSFNLQFTYRIKKKEINASGENLYHAILGSMVKQNFRLQLAWNPDERWEFVNRVDFVKNRKQYSESDDEGYLFSQDIAWKPDYKTAIHLRYALFSTDTYDERIYSYEHDVLYGFSIPGYYYGGSRSYLLVRYRITKNMDAWLRLSRTSYYNKNKISTQLEEIEGNNKTEVKLQLRLHI